MKDAFVALGAVKGPFVALGAVKGPFIALQAGSSKPGGNLIGRPALMPPSTRTSVPVR
jgi:hypothetical protein